MLHSEDNKGKLNHISYDDVTDISESQTSEIRENSPVLSVNRELINKNSEYLHLEGSSPQKQLTMNDSRMTRENVNPDKEETEVVLLQENQPVLTHEADDDDDDDDLDVIPVNDAGNVGTPGELPQLQGFGTPGDLPQLQGFGTHGDLPQLQGFGTPGDLPQLQGFSQTPPNTFAGNTAHGSMAPLSSDVDHFPDHFPDASDPISFNIADEQTEEEEDEQGPSGLSGLPGPPPGPTNFLKSVPMKSGVGPMEGPHNALPTPHIDSPGGDEDDDDDDDDDDVQAPLPEGSYDPSEYANLDVPPELKELFTYISAYTPQNIELEHKLRPFIPDYIPAVGDIDAFIKIPRPDGESSTIGLTVLDEPSAKQSDATVLDLQLRAVARHTTAKSVVVKTVDNAEKNGKVIEKWMRDISDLHRAKPPPTVHYSKQMPDIDSLMQEWPGEIEELMKEVSLPSAELQVELPHYVDLICSILDIPVYKSRIQSLHVFFTLYSVFKNSSHFRHLAEENIMENDDGNQEADHLVL